MDENVKQIISNYRRILYLLNKYKEYEPDDYCKKAILAGEYKEVASWYRFKVLNDLDAMSLRDLRDKAAVLRINPIWGVPKLTLIFKILEKMKDESQRHETKSS